MQQSLLTKAQVMRILKEQESGSPTATVCRKRGIKSGQRSANTRPGSAAWMQDRRATISAMIGGRRFGLAEPDPIPV